MRYLSGLFAEKIPNNPMYYQFTWMFNLNFTFENCAKQLKLFNEQFAFGFLTIVREYYCYRICFVFAKIGNLSNLLLKARGAYVRKVSVFSIFYLRYKTI